MKIHLCDPGVYPPVDVTLETSEKANQGLAQLLLDQGIEIYNNLPLEQQLMADQGARMLLYKMEDKAIEKGISRKDAMVLRPDKNEDATIKLATLIASNMSPFLDNVHIYLDLAGDSITDFRYSFNGT